MSTFLQFLQESKTNAFISNLNSHHLQVLLLSIIVSCFSLHLNASCTTCVNNKITNGGFNTNTTGWISANGNFTADNPYPQCSTAKNAMIQHTSGTAQFYQNVTGIAVGSPVELSFWAGVHNNSFNAKFGLEFYNGSTFLSESKVQIDKILGGSPSMQYYTINAVVPPNTTAVRVIGSTTGDWLKVDEVCLQAESPCVNFAALAQSDINLVKTRTISNEVNCNNGSPDRVLWLDCILDNTSGGTSGNLKYWKIISGGNFKEYCNGTAYMEMRVQNVVNANYKFDVSVIFTGRTYTVPSGSPHLDGCTSAATSNWYYYTTTNGSLIGVDGLAGAVLSFSRKGPSFQLGTNASLFGTNGTFGAAGWIMYNIITQPAGVTLQSGCDADLNFFLSGGNLTSAQSTVCGSFCAGTSTTLNGFAAGGKPGYTYSWSNSLGTGQNKTVTPIATTTYTVTVTDTQNCTSTSAVTITVNPSPTVSAGADATICTGQSIILTANASSGTSPYTYVWSNGLGTGASKTVSPAVLTTYTVTVTDAKGCTATDNVIVSVGNAINATATGGEVCLGKNITISASGSGGVGPYIYIWSDGLGSGASKSVSPAATKTYTVTVEDSNGCSKSANAVVNVNLPPTASVTGNNLICAGQNTPLTASGAGTGGSYTWSNGATTSVINVAPTTNSAYTVTVTNNKGCTATSSISITVKSTPTVNVGADINLCTLDEEIINSIVTNVTTCGTPGSNDCNHVLNGTTGWVESPEAAATCGDNAGTKLWTKSGQGTSSVTLDFGTNVPSGTTICVRMKFEHCSNTSSTQSDAKIQRSLLASSGYADVIASKLFSTTTYTEYCYTLTADTRYVRVTDNGKCSFRVDYVKFMTPDTYNNSITYAWNGPGIVGSTSGPSIIVNQGGTYVLVVTDCGGCSASDAINVNVNSNVTANAGSDKSVCPGSSVTLTATPVSGASYEWRTSSSNTVISAAQNVTVSPTQNTTYILKVIKNGCDATDAVDVTVGQIPVASITGSNTLCSDNIVPTTLIAAGGTSYLWSTGETTATIDVEPNVTTTYTVTVTNATNCTSTATKIVKVIACSGQICFNGANNVSATANWTVMFDIDPANDRVKIRATLSKNFVDNTYGSTVIGWPGGHSFSQLVGSDHLILSMLDGNNVKRMETKLDYITASNTVPSGYKCLGVLGGEGSMILGSSSDVLSVVTSMDYNCNNFGYVPNNSSPLLTNSPSTNANYTPNATYPNWIYDVWYEVDVKLSAFGAAGFGKVGITGVHASPSKTGNNTESVTEGPCCELDVTIAGNDIICPGGNTTLTANYNSNTTVFSNAIADTYLNEGSASTNYGSCDILYSGASTASKNRSIVKFDLNNVPSNATITSAKIVLVKTGGSNSNATDIGLHRVTSPWTEGKGKCGGGNETANWNQRQSGTNWGSAGGDFISTPESVVSVGANAAYEWTATNLVQGWITGSFVNNGVLIKMVNEGQANQKFYGSRNASNVTIRPMLAVTYSLPPASVNKTYAWSNGATTQAINVNPSSSTTYSVTITESTGCKGDKTKTVNIGNPPVSSAVNNGPLTCTLTSVTLTANPATGVSYLWSTGATTRNTTVSLAGTYSVTVTELVSSCTSTANTTVTGNTQIPTVNAGPDVTVNCLNPSAQLTASGSGTFVWNTGATTASISVIPQTSTTYTVTVTGSNGCTASDAVVVTANKAKPTANISATGNNCITPGAQLFGSASGGTSPYTFSYSGPNGFNSQQQNPFITNNGTYTLTVTDANGCTDSRSIVIFSEFLPIVIAVSTDICAGESVMLTASGGVSYLWGNGATTAAITVSPIASTTYLVTVTSAQGCVGSGSATITVYSKPVINSLDVVQNSSCNNTNNTGKITVNATGQAGLTKQYRINAGPWQLNNIFENLSNGIYNVEVAYTARLCFSDPSQATISSVPGLVAVAEDDKTVCANTTFNLSASASGGTSPYTYAWNNGMTGSPINVSGIAVTTTYTVTVTDAKGCTATDNIVINLIPPPSSGISGPDQACANDFVIFAVNPPIPGASYIWNFNGGVTASGNTNGITESVKWASTFANTFRTVSLTILKDNCPVTYVKQIYIKESVILNTPGLFDVCQGGAVQVGPNPNDPNQVSSGATFLWTPNLFLTNNTVAQPISTPPFDIVYTLTATINGCITSKQVNVNVDVNLNPIADAGPDESLCLGNSLIIGGSPTATPPPGGAIQGVVWSPAQGLNNKLLHNPTASPVANTTYQVIVVATSGCSDTAYMNLTVLPKPSVTLAASPLELCSGGSSVLTATPSGGTAPYTVSWSNSLGTGLTKTVVPIINSTYTVTVTDANSCSATATVAIIVNPKPTVNVVVNPATVCIGESSSLLAIGGGGTSPYTFEWSNNLGLGASKTVFPVVNTTYTVTITDSKGCTSSKTTTVNVEQKAKVGDFVWHDINGNGIQNIGEPGLNDITVSLYNAANNQLVASTSTASKDEDDGYYEFEVCKGTYYIIFGTLPTYVRTTANVPSDDTKDSDADPNTGKTSNFVLNPGDNNSTIDAGYYKLATMGDFVWFDANANGIQDGEIGVSGIQVNLTGVAGDGTLVNLNQPTNGSGFYLFSNLKPGVYTVQVIKPLEYLFSPANVGGDDTKDSDSDPGTGIMPSETLTSGEDNRTYDAGLFPSIDLEIEKTFISAVPKLNGSYDVTYSIIVNNLGGPGRYDLTDNQGFDSDVIINSSSFTSNAPANSGSALVGSGIWSLANEQPINAYGTHTYTLVVNVTVNLSDNVGNNIYNACASQTPISGQGLYNKAKVYVNDILKDEDDACGNLPNVTLVKNFVGVNPNANGSFTVTYAILVNNNGGVTGTYSLKDTPLFDNDVTIQSGNYSGQANGVMNTSGSTILATNANIAVGATHLYNITFSVLLNLALGSQDGGDNFYTPCAISGNGPGSGPGQGLYNKAELDRTGDGITDLTDDACGDLPNVTLRKDIVSVAPGAGLTYNVSYNIIVGNTGGATGTYSLKDLPLFDSDVVILSGTYSGQAIGIMNTTGSTTLATNTSIAAGATHNYTVTFNVKLQLEPGSNDPGNNIYTSCAVSGNGPGSVAGQGLYNVAELDRTGDGITDLTDDACGDLPFVTMVKDFVSITPKNNGSYTVNYQIRVTNIGGATGQYWLKDTPLFDDDVVINSGTYSGQANGAMNTSGSTIIATGVSINANATHTYNISFNVTLNLAPGSPGTGDKIYTPCAVRGNGPGSGPGQGYYNLAELDRNGDNITDLANDACGDDPITMVKNFLNVIPLPDGSHYVRYEIVVKNVSGTTSTYTLTDYPLFDDDVTINAWDYTFIDVNGGFGSGPSFLGTPLIPINLGTRTITDENTHIYTLGFNVTLDLKSGSTDGGDNIYTPCTVPGDGPGSKPLQALYNRAELEITGDGIPDIINDACGDIPNVTMIKNFVSATPNANGTYNVTYQILVGNSGGATGQYSLKDTPLFDSDVVILSGTYSGQANGNMNTSGNTTLATNISLGLGVTHTYTVKFIVRLQLEPGSNDPGNNIYSPCAVFGNGPGSGPGQGLYNRAELDKSGDGITDITDDACGDLPNVTLRKDIVSVTTAAGGTYNVSYNIIVGNTGGTAGTYSLKDTPSFDNDIVILSGTYSGQAIGNMNTTGSTTLATNTSIAAGATHNYTVTFNVKLQLEPGSNDPGNNIYTSCAVSGNGPGSGPGQGLYNKAELDRGADGSFELEDDACGDLPNVTMYKNFVGVTQNTNGSYNVSYAIVVNNNGGSTGTYSLKDTPLFDNDVTIVSGNFSGVNNGSMNTVGFTSLANSLNISQGITHIYTVTFTVRLNLTPGSNDGGDNIYTPCSIFGNGPGSGPGQGLYNRAELDRTGDGITDITDDACGDLPNITLVKNFVNVIPNAIPVGSYKVTYNIIVNNNGGAAGTYSLLDTPLFDNDVVIHSGTYSGQANGNMNVSGSTVLANAVPIIAGSTHTYTVMFIVTLNLDPNSQDGGNNVYTKCEVPGNGPGSTPQHGLYNRAELDWTGDNIPDLTDDACGDLPGSIGDFVWEDRNANGIQDIGEPGIPNVLVRLFNQSNIQINSMLTGPDGKYLFSNLQEGTYSVGFTKLFGYQATTRDVGDDTKDSDADVITGLTSPIFLNAGEQNLTIDAGFYRLARIGDFVWEDRNVNGLQDGFEPGLPGFKVNLSGIDAKGAIVNLSTTTSALGMYEFTNLVPGNYVVTFVKPGDIYIPTAANSGLDDAKDSDANIISEQSPVIVLSSSENNTTIDAGYFRCAKVGDYVWLDNGTMDNLQDAGDTGLNGITVELYSTSNSGVPYETQLTKNSPRDGKAGYYLFECMPPGEYFIKVKKPDLYIFVTPNQGLDDTKDSDIVDFTNEKTLNFTVSYAQIIEDIDIGFDFKPLPVNLTRFEGRWNKVADVNELSWETASEINSDYFDVERSFKGSEFKSVGKIAAAGNSNRITLYDFNDNDIKVNGVYSYRLRQVDFDGTETYSNIVDVLVERIGKSGALVYPNPAVGLVNIDLEANEGSKVIGNIYDNIGKLVMSGFINEVTEVQIQTYTVDVSRLNPGVYTIMLNLDGIISSYKLIILK